MPSLKSYGLLLAALVYDVAAKDVTNAFTSLEIKESIPNRLRGQDLRNATLKWEIDPSAVSAGDTITLDMPCVFRTFINDKITLADGDTVYATCVLDDSNAFKASTQMNCVVTDAISKAAAAVSGSVTFPFTFHVGSGASDINLKCAQAIKPGINTVNWLGLLADVSVMPGSFSASYQSFEEMFFFVASTADRQVQFYMLSGFCPGGIKSGSLAFQAEAGVVNCTSFNLYGAKELNSFMMPTEVSNLDKGFKCDEKTGLVVLPFRNAADSRAFFTGSVDYSGTTGSSVVTKYNYRLTCNDGHVVTKSVENTQKIESWK